MLNNVTYLFLRFYKTLPKKLRQPRVPSEPVTARQPLYVSELHALRQPIRASAIL